MAQQCGIDHILSFTVHCVDNGQFILHIQTTVKFMENWWLTGGVTLYNTVQHCIECTNEWSFMITYTIPLTF